MEKGRNEQRELGKIKVEKNRAHLVAEIVMTMTRETKTHMKLNFNGAAGLSAWKMLLALRIRTARARANLASAECFSLSALNSPINA